MLIYEITFVSVVFVVLYAILLLLTMLQWYVVTSSLVALLTPLRSLAVKPLRQYTVVPGCTIRMTNIVLAHDVLQETHRASLTMMYESHEGNQTKVTLASFLCGFVSHLSWDLLESDLTTSRQTENH